MIPLGHCYCLSLSLSLLPSLPLSLQVFHRTPAYEDGSLCPGDELVAVNGASLRGLSRKQTADMIQSSKVSKHSYYTLVLKHQQLLALLYIASSH